MFALPFAFQELLPADSHSAIIMQMFSGSISETVATL